MKIGSFFRRLWYVLHLQPLLCPHGQNLPQLWLALFTDLGAGWAGVMGWSHGLAESTWARGRKDFRSVYGHTTLNAPDLVWSCKLSRVVPGWYLDGRLFRSGTCSASIGRHLQQVTQSLWKWRKRWSVESFPASRAYCMFSRLAQGPTNLKS